MPFSINTNSDQLIICYNQEPPNVRGCYHSNTSSCDIINMRHERYNKDGYRGDDILAPRFFFAISLVAGLDFCERDALMTYRVKLLISESVHAV